MRTKKAIWRLLASTTLETLWAMGVSYTVGIAMSPRAHNNLPCAGGC